MRVNNIILPNIPALARSDQQELLDMGMGTQRDVEQNLAEMQRINDVLGGTCALTRQLYPRLAKSHTPQTVVDLGTGGAGLLMQIASWGRMASLPLQLIGIDWSDRNLQAARCKVEHLPEITLLRADAGHLPLPAEGVDYLISSLFLHHLSPSEVIAMLQWAFHIVRRGIIMSDLERGWFPYLGFRLIQPVLARHPLTHHDGLLSIRRAYTTNELIGLAVEAGLPAPQVIRSWPGRQTLVVEK